MFRNFCEREKPGTTGQDLDTVNTGAASGRTRNIYGFCKATPGIRIVIFSAMRQWTVAEGHPITAKIFSDTKVVQDVLDPARKEQQKNL